MDVVTGDTNLASAECSSQDNHANSIQRPVSFNSCAPQSHLAPDLLGRTSRFGLEAVV
jgi:hypothetical protein